MIKMKPNRLSQNQLEPYILTFGSDLYIKNVYYIMANDKKFARLSKTDTGWNIFYYNDKIGLKKKTLSVALAAIERHFIKERNEIFTGTAK